MSEQGTRKSWFKAFASLSFNQRVTVFLTVSSLIMAFGSLMVGGATAYVAYRSYRVAADTTDIKQAIRTLASVAAQSGRQADAQGRQLSEMQKQTVTLATQAAAAQGQLNLIKAQTAAISEQTTAMKETAAAAVRSANAQADAARTSERAQLPHVALEEMSIDGLTSQADDQGRVTVSLNVLFRNTGGGAFTQKLSMMGFAFEKDLPTKPDYSHLPMLPWGGNDYSVAPGRDLKPVDPPQLRIDKSIRDDLMAHKRFAFVYGTLAYEDSLGRPHAFCFAYRLTPEGASLRHPFPAGGPAYHCEQ